MGSATKNRRLRFLTSFFLIFFVIIAFRLFYLQIYMSSQLSLKASSQRTKDIQLLAKRGTISDRKGKVLAVSIKKQTVFATPYQVKDKEKAASELSKILKKPKNKILKKLNSPKGFIYIERKIDKDKADKIKSLKIEGISLFDEYKRYYPSGSIASQVLGFVGIDNNGLSGLEQKDDKTLSGKLGRQVYQQDAYGREIPGTTNLYNKPLPGKNIQLTIDSGIQYKAQEELKESVEEWGAKSGSVVVMNPANGEILAMANSPDFELNKFSEAKPENMKNRSIVDVFEPGSTMKPFFAAAAMEEKIFTPDTMFFLPPSINVNGKSISDSHDRASVNYSLTQIIVESSNVGMSKVGLALKKTRIVKYAKKFEFDKKTGIELPGEGRGVIPRLDQFYGPMVATVCFGQGISTTAVGLARGYACFANGGYLVSPHIVQKEDGKEITSNKKVRVISRKTAWDITQMLEKVVSEGTGKSAKVPGYLVAGKTGTAQKAEGSLGYSGGKHTALFAGFAPAENPKIVIIVRIDEPTRSMYGGVVAAPVFSKVMGYALSHLQINPQ